MMERSQYDERPLLGFGERGESGMVRNQELCTSCDVQHVPDGRM